MKTLLSLLTLLLFALPDFAQNKSSDPLRVSIEDENVANAIRAYVAECQIDVHKKVITIKAEIGLKKVFTITNYFSALHRTNRNSFTPTYYGVLDGKIVFFVFSQVEKTFHRQNEQILKNIDRFLRENKVTLSNDTHLTYEAPVWHLVEQCDGTYRLNKNVTPFEYESLPCGYSISRDSVKLDSIKLIKQ